LTEDSILTSENGSNRKLEKIHNGELHNLCSLPDIGVIKSVRVIWMRPVTHIGGKGKCIQNFGWVRKETAWKT
jgi:hypothetical protein